MATRAVAMNEESLRELLLENREQAATPGLGYTFELRRREFFKLLGGGLLVCLCTGPGRAQESGGSRPTRNEEELPNSLAAWLHISGDGVVTVYTGKVEVGQNIRTSLSQQVAEELRVSIELVQLVVAD